MKNFFIPDFSQSNVNISATLAEFLGAPNQNPILPSLRDELAKGYKNVVFICFDGLGMYPMRKNLPEDDFLFRNVAQVLFSTFPSTTTNATTSLMTNRLPLEHGWFGWSLHFEDLGKNVDIYMGKDSVTGEKVSYSALPLEEVRFYFDQAQSSYEINSVFPGYVRVAHPERNIVFSDTDDFFDAIKSICRKNGKQFVYAYLPEPDSTMHKYGVSSPEAQSLIRELSQKTEALSESTENTLFIITADHGQIDVTDYVSLWEDETLMDMLRTYPFLEARTPAFLVKEGCKQEFEEYFRTKYGKDFVLYKSEDLIAEGYFGRRGDKADLLGDYIVVGTYTHKIALLTPKSRRFKGHHTSLTEEMEVPLIVLGK